VLRTLGASYAFPVSMAHIFALGFLAHCNNTGVKCGFQLIFDRLKAVGMYRNKNEVVEIIKTWLTAGLVERGRNRGRFANLALRLTPDGHLLLHRFEALLQKAAEKGFYPDDPGEQG